MARCASGPPRHVDVEPSTVAAQPAVGCASTMRKPAGTLMVRPDIGSGRSFGTAKLTVRTPVRRNCGTGTTCADAPPDVTRATTRAQTARGARRTRRNDAEPIGLDGLRVLSVHKPRRRAPPAQCESDQPAGDVLPCAVDSTADHEMHRFRGTDAEPALNVSSLPPCPFPGLGEDCGPVPLGGAHRPCTSPFKGEAHSWPIRPRTRSRSHAGLESCGTLKPAWLLPIVALRRRAPA